MLHTRVKILLISLLIFYTLSCQARIVVERIEFPRKVVSVKIVDRIQYGEDEEFLKKLDHIKNEGYTIKNNAIQFNTRGGNTYSAMEIGKIIRTRKLNTFLAPNSVCGSACIFSISGGVVRNIYGKVSVHRESYNDDIPIEKIQKFLEVSNLEKYKHLSVMGMSELLYDAIITTPHWSTRYLSDIELRRWGINATDRVYEELYSRLIAKESNSSINKVQINFGKIKEKCEPSVKEFQDALWDCARRKFLAIELKINESEVSKMPKIYILENTNYTPLKKYISF